MYAQYIKKMKIIAAFLGTLLLLITIPLVAINYESQQILKMDFGLEHRPLLMAGGLFGIAGLLVLAIAFKK